MEEDKKNHQLFLGPFQPELEEGFLAFHAVMERLELARGSNLAELSRVQAMDQSILGLAEKLKTLCRKCLGHPLMERARKSKRTFREVPFPSP